MQENEFKEGEYVLIQLDKNSDERLFRFGNNILLAEIHSAGEKVCGVYFIGMENIYQSVNKAQLQKTDVDHLPGNLGSIVTPWKGCENFSIIQIYQLDEKLIYLLYSVHNVVYTCNFSDINWSDEENAWAYKGYTLRRKENTRVSIVLDIQDDYSRQFAFQAAAERNESSQRMADILKASCNPDRTVLSRTSNPQSYFMDPIHGHLTTLD